MSNNPTVSVICACYNQAAFIVESLDSVKNQTFRDFEIIVWDDASKDNSVAIIEKWIAENPGIRVQFVKHTTNKGICASLNECYRLSTGKYIQILALDDILLPWKLEEHVKLLNNSKDIEALVFTDAYIIDENNKRYTNRFIAYHYSYLQLDSGNYLQMLIQKNFLPAMSVLLKRSVIEDVGLWDENLVFEDYDMWLRISRKYDFIFDDRPSVEYRLHSNNTHKKINSQMVYSTFNLLLKHADIPEIKSKLKAIIESRFIEKDLQGVEKLYFSKFKPENMLERMIKNNRNVLLYRVLKNLIR